MYKLENIRLSLKMVNSLFRLAPLFSLGERDFCLNSIDFKAYHQTQVQIIQYL